MMPLKPPPQVMVLMNDGGAADHWAERLRQAGLHVRTSHAGAPDDSPTDVVVTDVAAWADLRERLGVPPRPLAQQRFGVVYVADGSGTDGNWADVHLPADCLPRELALACTLLTEVVRERARNSEIARQQDAFKRLAATDPLTGLPNRRAWDHRLERNLHDAALARASHWLGIVDLDRFKQINDTWGLAAGDAVLRDVAQAMAARLRHGDLLARLGGDEFGVLLVGVDEQVACKVFERLREAVASRPLCDRQMRLSASVGYAPAGVAADSADWFAAADAALRAAKRAGGNQLVRGTRADDPN